MKIRLHAEAIEPDGVILAIGRDVDWPAIPRIGDTVIADPHGDHELQVAGVQWGYDGAVTVIFHPITTGWLIRLEAPDDWGWEDVPDGWSDHQDAIRCPSGDRTQSASVALRNERAARAHVPGGRARPRSG